jgi:hypothetical protein
MMNTVDRNRALTFFSLSCWLPHSPLHVSARAQKEYAYLLAWELTCLFLLPYTNIPEVQKITHEPFWLSDLNILI